MRVPSLYSQLCMMGRVFYTEQSMWCRFKLLIIWFHLVVKRGEGNGENEERNRRWSNKEKTNKARWRKSKKVREREKIMHTCTIPSLNNKSWFTRHQLLSRTCCSRYCSTRTTAPFCHRPGSRKPTPCDHSTCTASFPLTSAKWGPLTTGGLPEAPHCEWEERRVGWMSTCQGHIHNPPITYKQQQNSHIHQTSTPTHSSWRPHTIHILKINNDHRITYVLFDCFSSFTYTRVDIASFL